MHKFAVLLVVVQISAAQAYASDYLDFVRISQPQENKVFKGVSDIAGSGHLYVSGIDRREDLEVRVRLYRLRDNDFDVIIEIKGQITGGIPSDKGTCRYKFDFKGENPVKEGTYLLVVECADKRDPDLKRVSSAWQFLVIGNQPRDNFATPLEGDQPARDQKKEKPDERLKDDGLIRIFVPREQDRYASTANIAGMGYFYAPQVDPNDVIVRIHFIQPRNGAFDIIQTTDCEIDSSPLPEAAGTCQILLNLRTVTPRRPGRYLLRADCLDVSGAETKLLATTSRFVTVVK